MIDNEGIDNALQFLADWDYGDETTQSAMENGYVYHLPPTGPLEHEIRVSKYDMTYSHSFGHVGLYRLHEVEPEDVIEAEPMATQVQAASWFEHPRGWPGSGCPPFRQAAGRRVFLKRIRRVEVRYANVPSRGLSW